jgi:hypothetical protein
MTRFFRVLLAVVVLFIPTVSFAQDKVMPAPVSGFVESQVRINAGTTTQLNAALDHPLKKKGLSVATWALKGSDWSEAYVGLTKSLSSWASVTGQVGLEQNDKPWRIAGTLWMGNAKTSALLILEEGGSGAWHKAVVSRQINPKARLGFMSQRFVGTGVYAEANIFGKVNYWVMMPVIHPNGVLAGLRIGF